MSYLLARSTSTFLSVHKRSHKIANGGYASVNGLHLYYEIHGAGEPLILLHGGLGAIEMFGDVLPSLAQTRQVVAVDLQAHGRTADIDRPLSFELMAGDIAALIKHLGFAAADVMGYSLGGGVALRIAIEHPEAVKKLVLVSTPFKREGWYPEILADPLHHLLVSPACGRRRGVPRGAPARS